MSVTEKPDPDPGLRTRLVDVGVDLLSREGVGALTLREIARRAGVSHGAPRRYFPTHLELLSAIAHRGFADLGALVTATPATAPPGLAPDCANWPASTWSSRRTTPACTS